MYKRQPSNGAALVIIAKASVDLPDTLILSATHQLNEKWELLGDISWTGWSSIPDLKIRNSGTCLLYTSRCV